MFDNLQGSKVLVTGHTGYIGSWLCFFLQYLGIKVYGYSLLPTEKQNLYEKLNIRQVLKEEKIADITDYDTLKTHINKIEPDYIVHLAALSTIKESIANPLNTYNVNVLGTLTLYEACRNCNSLKAIVNLTTDKCYDLDANKSNIYDEEMPLGGATDIYSSSKACSEILTSSYIKTFLKEPNKFNIITLRTGNAIGGGDWTKGRLIPDCLQSIVNDKPVLLRKPNAFRPWQHVLDQIVVILELLNQSTNLDFISKKHNSYNYGPNLDEHYSVLDVVKLLIKNFNKGSYKFATDVDMQEANDMQLNSERIKGDLNIEPVLNTLEAIEYTFSWYQEYAKDSQNILKFTEQQIKQFIELAKAKKINWAQS